VSDREQPRQQEPQSRQDQDRGEMVLPDAPYPHPPRERRESAATLRECSPSSSPVLIQGGAVVPCTSSRVRRPGRETTRAAQSAVSRLSEIGQPARKGPDRRDVLVIVNRDRRQWAGDVNVQPTRLSPFHLPGSRPGRETCSDQGPSRTAGVGGIQLGSRQLQAVSVQAREGREMACRSDDHRRSIPNPATCAVWVALVVVGVRCRHRVLGDFPE
jgi:hypothetical protein